MRNYNSIFDNFGTDLGCVVVIGGFSFNPMFGGHGCFVSGKGIDDLGFGSFHYISSFFACSFSRVW